MAMKRCPICGEKYSDTYKSCPFCEEEEALQSGAQIRRTAPGRGGKRTAAAAASQSAESHSDCADRHYGGAAGLPALRRPDRQRLSGGEETQDTSTEDVTPQPPDPDTADPEEGDGVTMPESGGTGEMEDPNDGGTTTPAQTDPSTLPETLTIAYLGSPRTEFTMSVGDEPIPLTVSGGSGTYTWSSSDDGIASVDSTGRVTAISSGQATLTVTDGSGKGTAWCGSGAQARHIYVASGGSTASGSTLTAGTAVVVNAGNGVRVRAQANTSSEILATLSNGDSVRVVQSAGNGWYQISFVASGGVTTTGYMMGEYLSIPEKTTWRYPRMLDDIRGYFIARGGKVCYHFLDMN